MPDWRLPTFQQPVAAEKNEFEWLGKETAVRPLPNAWGGFEVGRLEEGQKAHRILGRSHNGSMIGYTRGEELKWFNPAQGARVTFKRDQGADVSSSTTKDPDGGTWTIKQKFGKSNGNFDGRVETTISVDSDRDILFLPVVCLVLNPGSTNKDASGVSRVGVPGQ